MRTVYKTGGPIHDVTLILITQTFTPVNYRYLKTIPIKANGPTSFFPLSLSQILILTL